MRISACILGGYYCDYEAIIGMLAIIMFLGLLWLSGYGIRKTHKSIIKEFKEDIKKEGSDEVFEK